MPQNLRHLAHGYIRTKLLEGGLEPGTRLSSRALAREIGVSFIPVREAIAQLASEGLVRHEPGVGTFATRVDDRDLRELYDLREALEIHALGAALPRLDADALARMVSLNARLSELVLSRAKSTADPLGAGARTTRRGEWEEADREFHAVLLQAAGNQRLVADVDAVRMRTRVFCARLVPTSRVHEEHVCREHEELVVALTRGDLAAARAVLADHLRRECASALERAAARDVG